MHKTMKTSRIIHNTIAALALAWCSLATVSAEEKSTFSIMTLNVDGLPGQIYFFNVNMEGPMSAGSERISEYLSTKNYDILCLQEDFNYRWEIWSRLFAGYEHDEWTGGIITEEQKIDFAHLQNLKFPTDGLNTLWSKSHQNTSYERVAWQKSFGKFSHDFDDMITKGFRRHDVTLANGQQIVVYNMHMDAADKRDIEKNNDAKDKEARLAQWQQLRQYILEHLDERPVIVAGDMNSLYHNDPVKTEFIDPINASGKATCGDAWIEKIHGGQYPVIGGTALADEPLDKILYINPSKGSQITPLTVTLDKTGYQYEGKPMGDHYPLSATFQITDGKTAVINAVQSQTSDATAPSYTLSGIKQPQNSSAHGVQITSGKKIIK